MEFNAIKTQDALRKAYIDFLLEQATGQFPLSEADNQNFFQPVRKYLKERWEGRWEADKKGSLFADSLIEGLFPYEKSGKKFKDLLAPAGANKPTEEKPLHASMEVFLKSAGLLDRDVYLHQYKAFYKSVLYEDSPKSLIVSSGTGSGKTECFLIPMINRMLWNETKEELSQPGVRVLIIYPMNALVNNQFDRVVRLFKSEQPGQYVNNLGIYVASYTSKTEDEIADRERRNDPRHVCVRLSRKEIRNDPPHILITNYSMLQYMMLRSADNNIFKTRDNRKSYLQTIVLDEAHVYNGSLSVDISMLLRRVAKEFKTSMKDVVGIATSATIGNGSDKQFEETASVLFSKAPKDIIAILGGRCPQELPMPAEETTLQDVLNAPKEKLWDVLCCCNEARRIRQKVIDDKVVQWSKLGIPNEIDSKKLLRKMSQGRNGENIFLPFKLHSFFRSVSAIYSDLRITQEMPLGELTEIQEKTVDGLFPVFCGGKKRGDIYFQAFIRVGSPKDQESPLDRYIETQKRRQCSKFYFRIAREGDDENSRFSIENENGKKKYSTCPNGLFYEVSGAPDGSKLCFRDFGNSVFFENQLENVDPDMDDPSEQSENQLESIDTNEQSEDQSINHEIVVGKGNTRTNLYPIGYIGRETADQILIETLFNYLPDNDIDPDQKTNKGRTALVFADTRSGAAKRASAIQYYHLRDLIRQRIYTKLHDCDKDSFTFEEIVDILIDDDTLEKELTLPEDVQQGMDDEKKGYEYRVILSALIVSELAVQTPTRRSLESSGLVNVQYDDNTLIKTCPGCFSCDQWASFQIDFINSLRKKRAIHYPYMDKKRVNKDITSLLGWKIINNPWEMGRNEETIRDILKEYIPQNETEDEDQWKNRLKNTSNELAEHILNYKEGTIFAKCSRIENRRGEVKREFLVKLDCFKFNVLRRNELYYNSRNFHITWLSSEKGEDNKSVCFNEYQESLDYKRYTQEECYGIRSQEHTAQLESGDLEAIEKDFQEGKFNLLSCSTTMELGIDIGSLVAVLMGNMPPEPANYIQRAGRSGRSGQANAMALTILRNNAYDYQTMNNSIIPYKRNNRFVVFDPMQRPRQVKRHLNSYFLRKAFEKLEKLEVQGRQPLMNDINNPINVWGNMGKIFGNQEILNRMADWANEWRRRHGLERIDPVKLEDLPGKPSCLFELLQRALRELEEENIEDSISELVFEQNHQKIKCLGKEMSNTRELIEELIEAISHIKDEFNHESMAIQNARNILDEENGNDIGHRISAITWQEKQLFKKQLLDALIHDGIIPSFGFPVDVLPLARSEYDQQREPKTVLRPDYLAVSEFAPGNEIVINQKIYRPNQITANYKVGNSANNTKFDRIFYSVCVKCGHYYEGAIPERQCERCGHPIYDLNQNNQNNQNIGIEEQLLAARATDNNNDRPSPLFSYIRPSSFAATDLGEPVIKRPFIRYSGNLVETIIDIPQKINEKVSNVSEMEANLPPSNTTIRYMNKGKYGWGFILCPYCGKIAQEICKDNKIKPFGFEENKHKTYSLHAGERIECTHAPYRHVVLGTAVKTDVLFIVVPGSPNNVILNTIMTGLRLVIADYLQMDPRSIAGQVLKFGVIALYESGNTAGSGIMEELYHNWQELREKLFERLSPGHNPDCEKYCDKCLLSYDSARLIGQRMLDRKRTYEWLEPRLQELKGHNAGRHFISGAELLGKLQNSSEIMLVMPHFNGVELLSEEEEGKNNLITSLVNNDCVDKLNLIIPKSWSSQYEYLIKSRLYHWQMDKNIQVRLCDNFDQFSKIRIGNNIDAYELEEDKDFNDITIFKDESAWYKQDGEPVYPNLADFPKLLKPKLPQNIERLDLAQMEYRDGFLGSILNKFHINSPVESVFYSDRYMFTKHYFRNFKMLLKSFTLSPECKIEILSSKLNLTNDRNDIRTSEDLQEVVSKLGKDLGLGDRVDMKLAPFIEHKRWFLLFFEDGTGIEILCEHGMDISKKVGDNIQLNGELYILKELPCRDKIDELKRVYDDQDNDLI